jgi:tRNA nucleotidyltransferase (CCA-adding enzyme)
MSLISSEFDAISHFSMGMLILSPRRHSYVMWEGSDRVERHTSSTKHPQHQAFVATGAADTNVAERCRTRLSPELQELLHMAARLGDEAGAPVYAVGGFVRDLLLGARNEDLDLTVEGDGVAFARRLAIALGGISKAPSEFGTAVVVAPDGRKVDVATARRESYKHPAALPTVEPGSLRDDLFRRDFSLNAMAFALNGPEAFVLLDWHGGMADLSEGVIRVLHNRSFRDDPTRMFRAIRLEQRFGFTLHPHTLRLLHRAVDKRWIERLSGARLWRELRLMLEGESPVRCLERLHELQILPQIDASLTLSSAQLTALTRVAEARVELAELVPEPAMRAWLVYIAALVQDLSPEAIRRVCQRLALSPRVTEEIIGGIGAVEVACKRLQSEDDLRPSEVVAVLRTLPFEMVPLLLGGCPGVAVRERVRRFFTTWRHVRPCLTGEDLKRFGIPQGPEIGRLLARLLAAKLDGEAPTREAEEAWVRGTLAQRSEMP